MEKSIFDLFEVIFSYEPKPVGSICLDVDILAEGESVSIAQLSDIFEIYLHMFIYGFKKLNLTFTENSMAILKEYFASLNPSVKFNIEIEPFDTALFGDLRYSQRYCVIDSPLTKGDPYFIGNFNKFNRTKLNQFVAVYQDEYESMVFLSFDF